MKERKRAKRIVGSVSSDRMDKTIAVEVERLVKHDQYDKYIKRTARYKAHDEKNEAHVGDIVEIEVSRPLSKTKSWRLVRVVRRAHQKAEQSAEAAAQAS
jgi:small subunit ribosomal protein S17